MGFSVRAILLKVRGIGMLLAIMACGMGIVDHPWIDIVVHQSAKQVSFEFYREERKWWSWRKVPMDVWSLSIHVPGGAPTIWKVLSPDGRVMTKVITYGAVPEGFIQEVPSEGSPPPLQLNVEYNVSVRGGGMGATSFIYRGRPED